VYVCVRLCVCVCVTHLKTLNCCWKAFMVFMVFAPAGCVLHAVVHLAALQ
jgi:hypothetical protein